MRDRRVVLVGGQAVSLWCSELQDRLEATSATGKVLSRDVDLLGAAADARRASALLEGRVRLATWEDHTPLTGVITFLDDGGRERRLDVLHIVHGMQSDDIRDTAVQADVTVEDGRQIPVWLMHPERVMESRVHNSSLPNKQTALAGRQLRASIQCARAFSQLLLDERAAVRDVLRLNERIFKFALRNRQARRLAVEDGVEVFDAVLEDDRLGEQFLTRRLPQMRSQIQGVRERDRARRTTEH